MVGEEGRGAVLEGCLTKLMFASPTTQVVGMSATLSNLHQLAAFLSAEVFSDDFRPVSLQAHKTVECVDNCGCSMCLPSACLPQVELREYVKIGGRVFSVEYSSDGAVELGESRVVSANAGVKVGVHVCLHVCVCVCMHNCVHIDSVPTPSHSLSSTSPLPSPPLPSLPHPPQCPASSDEDHLLPLVMEVVPQQACLVFCPTKKNCQNVALLLAQNLPRWVEACPSTSSCVAGCALPLRAALLLCTRSLREYKQQERRALREVLRIEAAGRSASIHRQ